MLKKNTLAFIFVTILSAANLKSENILIEPITQGNLEVEQKIFTQAFNTMYKKLNASIDDPTKKLPENITESSFLKEKQDFSSQKTNTYFAHAKYKNTIVGYISFEKTSKKNEVYIRQLAVHPNYQRKGIATSLIFTSIFKTLPQTTSIVVISRKANHPSLKFYRGLGFKKSKFMYKGYSRKLYTGLKFKKTH